MIENPTFCYKYLGRPRTYNEFIDKVQRKGNTSIDIVLKHNDRPSPELNIMPIFFSNYSFILQSDGIKLKLPKTYIHYFDLVRPKGSLNSEKKARQSSLRYATKIAYRLQQHGLEVTIGGEPLEKAREEIIECTQEISNLVKEIEAEREATSESKQTIPLVY